MKENELSNFGERRVKDGIHRVVNGLPEEVFFNAKPPSRQAAKQERPRFGR